MCLMCGRMKRNLCSPGFKDYQLRMLQFQGKERQRERKKKKKKERKNQSPVIKEQSVRQTHSAFSGIGDNHIKTSRQLVLSSKDVSCHGKRHSRTAHQTHSARMCLCYQGWISGSLLFFSLPFLKRRKGCGGMSGTPRLSAPVWTSWRAHTKLETNCLSSYVPRKPLSIDHKS